MSISPRQFSARPSHSGFTLIEVTVSLLILALIAGGIFAALQGTISEAASIRDAQTRQQQIDGLLELCRTTFRTLPGNASVESRVREEKGKTVPELIFRNAPFVLAWDSAQRLDAVTVLGLRPQIGGLSTLSILRVSDPGLARDPVDGVSDAAWMPLVPDLSKVSWRFYDASSGRWLDLLPRGTARPTAVELQLTPSGATEPVRMVFWIPPVVTPPVATTFSNTPDTATNPAAAAP